MFGGVTTYPVIVTLEKPVGGQPFDGDLRFIKIKPPLPQDLTVYFAKNAARMPRSRLNEKSWNFESDLLATLRQKIQDGKQTLAEVYGQPLYGIKTGLNEAFVIDTATRDRLVAQDARSAELLKPMLRGEDVKRWGVEQAGLFMINTPKGRVDIEAYPAVRDWLLPFKTRLEERATKQEWYELQQAQLAYQPAYLRPKVLWPQFLNKPEFCLEPNGLFPINKCYLFPHDDLFLVSLLNSKCLWFCFASISVPKRGGFREATAQHIGPLPLPAATTEEQESLRRLGESCTATTASRLLVQTTVLHRIGDLCPTSRKPKFSQKLNNWWTLDFSSFRGEVKSQFGNDIPVGERNEWEAYLKTERERVDALSREITAFEAEIDEHVYNLFDLTPDEIRLLEELLQQ